MDIRKPLAPGTSLSFPGMVCTIERLLGCGSNAIVYRGSYEDNMTHGLRHTVLVKELFPLHEQGAIHRDDAGCIVVEDEGWETWESHLESFRRGNQMHLTLLQQHPEMIGGNLNTYQLNGTWYSLLATDGSRDMEAVLREQGMPRDLTEAVTWMLGLLEALKAFHDAGYLHMDIAPDNILLGRRESSWDVMLIDYNSVQSLMEWRAGGEVHISYKDGYTASEVMNRRLDKIGTASDLYAATAVFFRMLHGRSLTLSERIAPRAPDGHESALLKDAPDTVCAMVKQLLQKGLSTMVKRRYQTVDELRRDLLELQQRIDCVGVTPWAILEKQRQRMEQDIRMNPSLAFLKNEDDQFPVRLQYGLDKLSSRQFADRCIRDGQHLMLLRAAGGMGKTTAMRLLCMELNARYALRQPVAVYLSAVDYHAGDSWFIHNSILQQLKFTRETQTYDAARHELDLLLQKPIAAPEGDLPALLILLDGLNEVAGDKEPLLREVRQLAAMPGAVVMLSSRSEAGLNGLPEASLCPLERSDVSIALQMQGLLLPEQPQIQTLLTTPLMLSMFIRTARDSGDQVQARDADEMMASFMKAITKKQILALDEGSSKRWQIEAAAGYVLPALANAIRRARRALTPQEALKVVHGCYKALMAVDLQRAFPQWLGHNVAIRGNAKTPQEWYGVIVQDILWRQLGVLTVADDGRISVYHQELAEWLAGQYRAVSAGVRRGKLRRGMAAACACAVLCVGAWRLVWVPWAAPMLERMAQDKVTYVDEEQAKTVVGNGRTAMSSALTQLG